jgi:hypothetical protein
VALGLVAGGLSTAAQATQPSTNVVEQHWDLLSETATLAATSGGKDLIIRRGDLPGGTGSFDPQPTATLEVVGKHTGGAGISRWDVALRTGSTDIAVVKFFAADNTLTIKDVPLTWSSSLRNLRMIRLTRVHDGLDFAGSFEIRKAYIKIHQAGTIKKTVGRVPLAVKQTTITNSGADWDPVTDLVYYQHRAADFNPAPTATFRTTGVELTANPLIASLHVRLVDNLGTVVAENVHESISSVESVPFTLVDGRTYHVEVQVTITGQIGDLYSAELVLTQSTSSTDGLLRTVGWYPSVTAGADLATDDTNLNFPMRAPALTAPEVRGTWIYTAKRVTGSGTQAVGVDLDVEGAPIIESTSIAVSTPTLKQRDNIPSIAANSKTDSRTNLIAGATGRLSVSTLRAAIDLHSASAPIISLSVSDNAFSPNTDGTLDFVAIQSDVDDVTLAEWTLQVTNTDDEVVWSATGEESEAYAEWDGLDSDGLVLADGDYYVQLAAVDLYNNSSASTEFELAVDTNPPILNGLIPADGSGTMFTTGAQRLKAIVADAVSGVDSASLSFTLHSELGDETLSAVATGMLMTASPAAFVSGVSYSLEATAADHAGNVAVASHDAGFGVTYLSAPMGTARVVPTPCELTDDTTAAGRLAHCRNVPVRLDGEALTMSDRWGGGRIDIRSDVSFDTLQASPDGTSADAIIASGDGLPWEDEVMHLSYFPATTPGGQTLTAQRRFASRNFDIRIPAEWTSASVFMAPLATESEPEACSDPYAVSPICSQDPVKRYGSWEPSILEAHLSACDEVLTAQDSVVVTPLSPLHVGVLADEDLSVASASLRYRVSGGTEHEVAAIVDGQSVEAVVPGSELPEGAKLEWVMDVVGSFETAACSHIGSAAFPAAASATALATADATDANPLIAEHAMDARLRRKAHLWKLGHDLSSVCEGFASPTACELPLPQEVTPPGSGGAPQIMAVDPDAPAGESCLRERVYGDLGNASEATDIYETWAGDFRPSSDGDFEEPNEHDTNNPQDFGGEEDDSRNVDFIEQGPGPHSHEYSNPPQDLAYRNTRGFLSGYQDRVGQDLYAVTNYRIPDWLGVTEGWWHVKGGVKVGRTLMVEYVGGGNPPEQMFFDIIMEYQVHGVDVGRVRSVDTVMPGVPNFSNARVTIPPSKLFAGFQQSGWLDGNLMGKDAAGTVPYYRTNGCALNTDNPWAGTIEQLKDIQEPIWKCAEDGQNGTPGSGSVEITTQPLKLGEWYEFVLQLTSDVEVGSTYDAEAWGYADTWDHSKTPSLWRDLMQPVTRIRISRFSAGCFVPEG